MEQTANLLAPEAPADESASPFNSGPNAAEASGSAPSFADPPLISDSLDAALGETLEATFAPHARKPRHDGWTPEAVAGFLRHLAATGVVEHAARAVGLSAASAYAFRNRRQGRAFAKMWDAVLVHRARARVAGELQARAIAGCVSVRKRDGEVVGEYHYYDNRLAMSLLARLDRLAEREDASDAHLRALSEDLDEFCDCLAEGGDADAFVETRRPAPDDAETSGDQRPPAPPDSDLELTTFARLAGCPHYRDVDPRDIDVHDLDPSATDEWSPDQWVRAIRSGFMDWLDIVTDDGRLTPGPGAPLRFMFKREAARLAEEAESADAERPQVEPEEVDVADLDTDQIWDWTADQLARGWRSGLIQALPPEFWDGLAGKDALAGDEE
jgi:hypothetical protein